MPGTLSTLQTNATPACARLRAAPRSGGVADVTDGAATPAASGSCLHADDVPLEPHRYLPVASGRQIADCSRPSPQIAQQDVASECVIRTQTHAVPTCSSAGDEGGSAQPSCSSDAAACGSLQQTVASPPHLAIDMSFDAADERPSCSNSSAAVLATIPPALHAATPSSSGAAAEHRSFSRCSSAAAAAAACLPSTSAASQRWSSPLASRHRRARSAESYETRGLLDALSHRSDRSLAAHLAAGACCCM